MGVAAMVLGLVGIAICWFPLFGWGGVGLAALGLVVGAVAIRKGIKGLGIAGLLLGLIGVLWGTSAQLEYLSAADSAAAEQGAEPSAAEPVRTPGRAGPGHDPARRDRL